MFLVQSSLNVCLSVLKVTYQRFEEKKIFLVQVGYVSVQAKSAELLYLNPLLIKKSCSQDTKYKVCLVIKNIRGTAGRERSQTEQLGAGVLAKLTSLDCKCASYNFNWPGNLSNFKQIWEILEDFPQQLRIFHNFANTRQGHEILAVGFRRTFTYSFIF